MTTLVVTHGSYLDHDTGAHHPERPDRLRSVLKALEQPTFHDLKRAEAPAATVDQMALAHPRDFVKRLVAAMPDRGLSSIDGDTVISPGTAKAMPRAAGAVIRAVDAVMSGEADNAFCAVRPPGHHAESNRVMGFCLVNNAAIGAYHARAAHGIRRVAVIDFDVHHGNGTQDIFWDDADAFYASTHQYPLYPGTGAASETGAHNNVVNVPLRPGSKGDAFRDGMLERVLPALTAFKPGIVIISAGFDAHKDDPLANLGFVEEDYAWATQQLMNVARSVAGGRVVSVLEGGYNLDALAYSVTAHVETLKDH
ncbi:MAG: histone deacetylase family protein [Alphaproteobacteria bacterium]|nr:histone deacetylase family protein [Alphaproteobacteria bacterium]